MPTSPDISMTPDEIRSFLESQRDLHVATTSRDGTPHVVAVWFAFLDDQLVFWGQRNAHKIRNLRRDRRLAISSASGDHYAAIRGLTIRGNAELLEGADEIEAVGRAVLHRNFDATDRPDAHVLAASGSRIAVRVSATKIISWDFSKKAVVAPPT